MYTYVVSINCDDGYELGSDSVTCKGKCIKLIMIVQLSIIASSSLLHFF